MKKCHPSKRFIVGNLSILSNPTRHANAIILDTVNHTLTRFEPHGSGKKKSLYNVADLNSKFESFVRGKGRDYGLTVYLAPQDFCARVGPQRKGDNLYYQDFDEPIEGQKDRGWCAIVALMFIHHRLANPTRNNFSVERMMSNKSEAQLAMEIRSYANAVALNVDPSVQLSTTHLSTTVKTFKMVGDLVVVEADMKMNEAYPKTLFRRARSSFNSQKDLIQMSGTAVDVELDITVLRSKMEEKGPKALIGERDMPILAHAELVMFYHVLQALHQIQLLSMRISQGFQSSALGIRKEARLMPPSDMEADMTAVVGAQAFQAYMSAQEINPPRPPSEVLRQAWTLFQGIRLRAQHYVQTLGFAIESQGLDFIVVTTTRQNIYARCRELKQSIEPSDRDARGSGDVEDVGGEE